MSGTDPTTQISGGSKTDCPGPTFDTTLASPNPTVVRAVSLGDTLSLDSVDSPVRAVVAVTAAGDIAGAIIRDPARLRACIAQGVRYYGEVVALSGGSVTLRITGY